MKCNYFELKINIKTTLKSPNVETRLVLNRNSEFLVPPSIEATSKRILCLF